MDRYTKGQKFRREWLLIDGTWLNWTDLLQKKLPWEDGLQKILQKKNPEIYKKIYSLLEKNDHKNFLKSYKPFVHYQDDDNMIKKINVNTLITTGENDVGSTPEMAWNLSKVIHRSKFMEIKKGKHLCSIECADNVNIIFKEFIDKNNG